MSTAVILAARRERNSKVPFPLRPFKTGGGMSCLMDRTLSILGELQYDNIYIVVGFMRELYNKDYAFTSAMGSLAVAEPYVKEDFILIESDTFYEKKVLEQLTATKYETWFSVTG